MTDSTASPPRKTPLFDVHKRLGGKLIDFGGWSLPVNYSGGILAEHAGTRNAIGVFDVSHMGELHFRGPRALEALENLVTNSVGRLKDGQALYTVACTPQGGIVDDLIVYRIKDDHYLTVVNASNIEKDFAWFKNAAGSLCSIEDESDATALIAFQGPKAVATLETLGATALGQLPSFGLTCDVEIAGHAAWVARTGYTGEDGVEIFCAPSDAPSLFEALVTAAAREGGGPAGLGARDTLRLEAKLPLYGNDLSDATSPLEAGLGWVVKLDKGSFIGSQALAAQKAAGVQRRLVGFVMKERGIPRHGYPALESQDGRPAGVVGEVTSGGVGPTVGKNVGMAYVPSNLAAERTELFIDCRGKTVAAEVVSGPFYRRNR